MIGAKLCPLLRFGANTLLPRICVLPNNARYISLSACRLSDRLFTDKHEWITVKGNVGTVGISDYGQSALGDIVYVQLPEVGQKVEQYGECGAVESVKAASEIYSPVSGKVTEINTQIEGEPGIVNKSCYDKGWLFKVELKSNDELKKLMSEKKYEEFVKTVEH